MPRNGSGTFNRLYSWEQDAANNIKIRADRMDAEMDGMATALTNSIAVDGQTASVYQHTFKTKADAETSNLPSTTDAFFIQGYTSAGDGGGALYKRVGSEPSHAGKIQSGDGAWWELAEQFVNIKMFGAKMDYDTTTETGTDDSASVQNAVEFSKVAPIQTIWIPSGDCLFNSPVVLTEFSGIIRGAGINATRIHNNSSSLFTSSATGNPFASPVALMDFACIAHDNSSTAINLRGTPNRTSDRSQGYFSNLEIKGADSGLMWDVGLRLNQMGDSYMESISVAGDKEDWSLCTYGIWIQSCVNMVMNSCRLFWGGTSVYIAGNSEGGMYINSHSVGWEVGLRVNGVNGNAMQNVQDCHMNTSQYGIWHTSTDGTTARASNISNNNLIQLVPSVGGIGGDTDYDWIAVELNGQRCVVSNNTLRGSLETSSKGLVLSGECDQSLITGNWIGGCSATAIQILSGADDCRVIGNVGKSSGLMIGGADNIYARGNSPEIWVDENRGTATVSTGSTSITVSHGLSVEPALNCISVTPINDMGSATKFWITKTSATEFDINVDQDPSSSNARFVWEASLTEFNL